MPGSVTLDDVGYAYRAKSTHGWRRRDQVHWALRGINLRVDPGEAIGLVGSNGSGKTTLLQCVAGVLRPTEGRLEVDGRVSALVHIFAGFHRELTGRENLVVSAVLNGLSRREVRQVADEIIDFSGLPPEVLDEPFRTYSSGMGLRLGFSVVVHTRPDVLVVDEILAVGDEEFQRRCLERVRELRSSGSAVIVVSHDLSLLAAQCDRGGWLCNGSLAAVGAVDDVIEQYRSAAPGDVPAPDGAALLLPYRERRRRRARR